MTSENRILLLTKIEEAILLASELGNQAFDAIEGRGLYHLRLEIQKIIQKEET